MDFVHAVRCSGHILYMHEMEVGPKLKAPGLCAKVWYPLPFHKDLSSSAQSSANFYLWQKVTTLCLIHLTLASCCLLLAVIIMLC